MMQGNNAEARAVIEQSLPACADNSGKTLLQSLLFGSLSYLTKLPAPVFLPRGAPAISQPPPTASQPVSMTAVIPANSPDGYSLGAVAEGTKITLQYESGLWKAWGRLPTVSPDEQEPHGGDICRLAIAQPGTEGAIGAVVAIVPSGTRYTPFVFKATQDYPALLLRINSPTFSGPGKVIYTVTVEAPSK